MHHDGRTIRILMALCSGVLAGCATGAAGARGASVQLTSYAATRSEAIMQTTRQAEDYCRAHSRPAVRLLREETVYQGQLDEDISATAQTAAKVAAVFGSQQAGQAGTALSSPTDYKTTINFVCQE